MGHNDELIRNKSAFASEMSDAAAIVQYADKNSLVVLDELARSTSTEEGIAITYAICEKVLKLQSYTFLATHFLDIAALANYSNAIDNYHFLPQTDENSTKKHKLLRGQYRGPLYGFELVELSTIPDEVIEHAQSLATELRANVEDTERDYDSERRRIKVYMNHRFRECAEYFMDTHGEKWKEEKEAIDKMKALRKYLVDELAKIDSQEQMCQ